MKRTSALLPYAVFLLLAFVSWNRWIEPFVDSGRELMVPWRVSRGQALYREIQFFHGPLAPYAAAGIDRVAGRSLAARIGFAALLSLLHLEALRRITGRALPAGRAGLAAALAVALAFFLRPGGWLFPFSFDTAIAVAAVSWALVFASGGATRDLPAALCLLAALLSRPELGAAAIAAIAFEARSRPRRLRIIALAPLALSGSIYAALSFGTPIARLVSGGWLALLRPPAAFRNVYRVYAGLDRPALRLAELALAAIALILIAALLALAAAAARAAGARPRLARALPALALSGIAASAFLALRPPAGLAQTLALLPPLIRVVPVVLLVAALARLVALARGRPDQGAFARVPDSVLFLAALFGVRLFLAAGYAGPYNAFFQPLAVVVACAGLWRTAQMWTGKVGAGLPGLVTGSLAIFLAFRALVLADAYRNRPWTRVTTPAGSVMLPEPVAQTSRLALEDLSKRSLPRRTLAGFPEGGFFNYVLGLENPLPLEQFFPGRLDAAGESRIIHLLEENPPDAVVLINVVAVGEGARDFGKDYLPRLDQALRRDFSLAAVFGPGAKPDARVGDPDFFIEIRVPVSR